MSQPSDYTNLITSKHSDKPKFVAMVAFIADIFCTIQNVMLSMIDAFDVDLASGVQLDQIGVWVGISRNVAIALPPVTFSWDGTDPTVGWDMGIWEGVTPGAVTVLPDDVYRTLIRAKIASNSWDGTTNGAYKIWESIFPDLNILIQDNNNMSYELAIVGGTIDSLTLALLTGGYIKLKPEGIQVTNYYIPSGSGSIFGYDLDTEFVQGWDEGSWTQVVSGS